MRVVNKEVTKMNANFIDVSDSANNGFKNPEVFKIGDIEDSGDHYHLIYSPLHKKVWILKCMMPANKAENTSNTKMVYKMLGTGPDVEAEDAEFHAVLDFATKNNFLENIEVKEKKLISEWIYSFQGQHMMQDHIYEKRFGEFNLDGRLPNGLPVTKYKDVNDMIDKIEQIASNNKHELHEPKT